VTDGITWLMPCRYVALTSPFGWRIHPVYGYARHHDGVDLANAQGTPITASRAGTVTIAKYSSSAGYYVTVNHGDGFSSYYMHLTHYVVGVGDKVQAGQLLGFMGSTGVSTGPHLHYAISYQGVYQNPADYHNFR
jgi:murein DD-endopeptidase MepM/ murein hydrolase activator NlpD